MTTHSFADAADVVLATAVGLVEFGGPEVLHILSKSVPPPGPGEVRIRVTAAAVNPTDILMRSGATADRLSELEPPFIPGMDAAGHIDAVGPDCDGRLRPGDPVVAVINPNTRHGGAYADTVVVPEKSVVAAPKGASLFESSTLLMNALTAKLALDELALSEGQTLAVTGAAGAFGGYAIQLAKAAGLEVIADASSEDHELVADLGADIVVPRGELFSDHVRLHFPDGVDGLADGANLTTKILPAVADGGTVAVIRGWRGESQRGIRIVPIWVSVGMADTSTLAELVSRVEQDQLSLRVADVVPASEAVTAHKRLEGGGVRGRIVLAFNDLEGGGVIAS